MTPPVKADLVSRITADIEAGISLRRACRNHAASTASYARWKAELDAAAGDPFSAFAPAKPTGRPASFEPSEEELAVCRWHRLSKGSLPVALHFAARDERLSAEARDRLLDIENASLENGLRPSFPPSVRRAFFITDEEAAKFRSRKATHNVEMMTPRGMLWVDENGELHDLLPGQLWELDDYSANQPYTWTDPATGEPNLGRQVLAAIDVASAGWLGFDHIGRERDAYRGEDIVRYLGRLFRAHGLPLFLRLERGSWESSFVHGLEVEGMTEKWGALDALVTIKHTWKSKGKGLIESSFNPLQTWLSHTGRDVGRFRGEFELATKAWLQAKKTGRDPKELGFLTADGSAAAHAAAAELMNSRPRERRALKRRVAADDLRAELGWHTTPFPESEAWRLLPYRKRTVVNGGLVNLNPGGGWQAISFVVNGVSDIHLDNGHAVLVAYDPARPDLGAYLANADTSHRNRKNWPMGEPLFIAPVYEDAPQIDLSGVYQGGAIPARKKASAAVATSFRAITAAGRTGGREAMAANGRSETLAASTLAPLGIESPAPSTPNDRETTTLGGPPRRETTPAVPADRDDRDDRLAALRKQQESAWQHF